MVICLEQGADLHIAQLMPLPLTVSCFSKIQIGFDFLVPAHLGSPGKRAVKRVCVCVCVFLLNSLDECENQRSVLYCCMFISYLTTFFFVLQLIVQEFQQSSGVKKRISEELV